MFKLFFLATMFFYVCKAHIEEDGAFGDEITKRN